MKATRLKGLFAALAAGAMLFSLAGCAGGASSASDSAAGGSSAAESATGADNSDKMLKVGVKDAVIGFGYKDPLSGEYEGLEIDLANKLAESMGYKGVEFTTVTAATRTELLDSGDLDCVLATFTITEERKKSWDFSTPYFTDAVTVLVEKADGITDLTGLVGKKIGVSTGSTSAYALVKAMTEKGLLGDYALPESSSEFDISSFSESGTSFEQFGDYPAISNAMTAGTVDAFCVDKSILATYKSEDREYIADKFSPQEYGVATKKGSPLSAQIDGYITTWLADGTIDALIAQYGLN